MFSCSDFLIAVEREVKDLQITWMASKLVAQDNLSRFTFMDIK